MRTATAKPTRAGTRNGRGFSLIEICVALAIVAILAGAVFPSVSGWLKAERLRSPSRRLELLARTARIDAVSRSLPFDVVVRPHSLSLDPASPDGETGGKLPLPYELPDSVSVLTMTWGESSFSSRAEFRWRFQPSGLCAPFSARFVKGPSQVTVRFNPLTAAISEESYEIH